MTGAMILNNSHNLLTTTTAVIYDRVHRPMSIDSFDVQMDKTLFSKL